MGSKILGVDFGTSTFKLYKKGKGIVIDQKNIIAIENPTLNHPLRTKNVVNGWAFQIKVVYLHLYQ